jgi:hypothetical protein
MKCLFFLLFCETWWLALRDERELLGSGNEKAKESTWMCEI